MTKYTKEELNKILEDHRLWRNDSTTGKRADLRGANLEGANMQVLRLKVMVQIKKDVTYNDFEELYKLLKYIPSHGLETYLKGNEG